MSNSIGAANNGCFSKPYLLEILEVLDTPISLGVWLRLKNGLEHEVIAMSVRPIDFNTAYDYHCAAQSVALFKKNPLYRGLKDPDEVALEKFFEAEEQCRETNDYFRRRMYVGSDTNLAGYLYLAKNFIQRILKSSPTLRHTSFGPGATSACRGAKATIVDKLSTLPECTLECRSTVVKTVRTFMLKYGVSCGLLNPFGFELNTEIPICKGNTFTTVPKDGRSSRGICIEPHGNLLVQKGIGFELQRLLRNAGYDLTTLPNEHRRLAFKSSMDNRFATIDLSSASDTICTELVKELLPPGWFDILNLSRSKQTFVNGKWHRNEKFSSMGNGFTFELETLIFLSLSHAVKIMHGDKDDRVSVFGDDIIVPNTWAYELIGVLETCGFRTNLEKTFVNGSFKESCGGDFYNGHPVRPVFIKSLPANWLEARYTLLNRVRLIAYRFGFNSQCDGRFKRLWSRLLDEIPFNKRCFGPAEFKFDDDPNLVRGLTFSNGELGDSVINTHREAKYSRRKGGIYRTSYLARLSRNKVVPQGTDLELACALYGMSSDGVSPRNARYSVEKRHITVSCWDQWNLSWSY